jgi:hypothetical protein
MFKLPEPPSYQADTNELADFIEFLAWEDKFISEQGMIDALRKDDDNELRTGCDSSEDDTLDRLPEVMVEVERRISACRSGYPFELDREGTVLRHIGNNSEKAITYRFLLLSTRLNMLHRRVHGGVDGAHLLEELSAHVLKKYLGEARSRSIVFGTAVKGSFRNKINKLCELLGEGGKCKAKSQARRRPNDGKLDIVGWVPFADGLPSKLIVFGQCKTGTGWREAMTHLQPDIFVKLWMDERLPHDPVRAFFISEASSPESWIQDAAYAGLFFDRCRLVDYCDSLPPQLLVRMKRWCAAAKQTVELPRRIASRRTRRPAQSRAR